MYTWSRCRHSQRLRRHGTIRQKEEFRCVQRLCRCLRSRTAHFRTLLSNISAKTKNFAKLFLPVHMGPRSNLLSQENGRKSCDTVPVCGLSLLLEVISSFVHRNRYCYIYKHFHKQSSFYIIFVCAFYSVEDTMSSSSNWRELLS